jgi:rubredoxin
LEAKLMELIYYKCPLCGFIYQVPQYWMDYSPENEMEMEHINLETKETCSEIKLQKVML